MNRRTVDTRLSSAPTHLIKREPGNEANVAHVNGWVRYSPCAMQSGMHDDVTTKSIFLRKYDEHFDVVLSTQ